MTEIAPGAEFGEAGRYRLRHLLGTGGMASVWLADDSRLQREVAVKILSDVLALDPEFVARFSREARVAGSLSHPHLVQVFDYSSQGTRPYLVMEYVAGGTLADRLRDATTPAWNPLTLSRELLDALGHVHTAGIVHRDIKPANVLIGLDGRVRLTDFGIAQPTEATRLTTAGGMVGTERYLPPEVRAGQPADARSDLYSLGVLLRECLGPGAGPELHRLVGRLTEDEPARRPASAAAALAVLREPPPTDEPTRHLAPPVPQPVPQSGGHTAVMPAPATTVEPPRPPKNERRPAKPLGIATAAAVVVAVGIAIAAAQSGGGGDREPLVVPPAGTSVGEQLDALEASIDRARG